MKIKIFLFHRVSSKRDPLWDPISPEKFKDIIQYLSKKYNVVSLEDQIINNSNSKINSKQYAAIVFDDGYKDFMDFALPVLKKYNCPSSMYVVTDCVTQQIPPWTYILDHHFINSKKLELNLNHDILPANFRVSKFNSNDSRIKFAKDFKLYLKMIPNALRVELYEQTIRSLNDVEVPSDLMMNWDELKQIRNEGVEIGSHSASHPLLAQIENRSEILNEIKGSGEIIEKHLGYFPKTISYPIGSYNEMVKEIAKECGYKLGLAVNQQFYDSSKNDQFEIPRVELYNSNLIKTRLRISGIVPTINKWLKR